MGSTQRVSVEVDLAVAPATAFETVLGDLRDALSRGGIDFETVLGGRLLQEGVVVATATVFEPARRLVLDWRPAPWNEAATANMDLRFDPVPEGTHVTCTVDGWEQVLGDSPGEMASWFGGAILAPVFRAMSPAMIGDWLTDRTVRRPSGAAARKIYADPLFHWPNFLLILERLALRPDDRLLEVGCGGGAFIRRALESGCRATAIDHSPEMVRLATEQNAGSVARGVLTVLEGEADRLPVRDESFTCAVMTGVIMFLPDPVAALREIRRALHPGGRIAVFGGTSALRGTPAAPEPFASRLRFFEADELAEVARRAGFLDVAVEEPDLEPFARAAHLPEEAIPMFRGRGGALLLTGHR
ncbi:MAG: methyltransferase domain-containing protein [Thermoplasmata archaeon]